MGRKEWFGVVNNEDWRGEYRVPIQTALGENA
jgi:hypothetical protein